MASATAAQDHSADTFGAVKDLYEVGEIPPLGHVPKQMYAWTIRAE
ncbi:MAG: crotonyl-CoA carboxylase/reductase, partial [Pseudomonadota bacterium]